MVQNKDNTKDKETKTVPGLDVNNIKPDRQQKIDQIKKALVHGARALHMNPILMGDKKTTRLPLVTWVGATGEDKDGNEVSGRFFILGLLAKHYGATMADVAVALYQIKQERLAYVDTVSVRVQDLKDVMELLADAMFVRGNGKQAIGLEHQGKMYVRDLNQADTSKGKKKGKPFVVPNWMLASLTEPTEPLTVTAGGVDE